MEKSIIKYLNYLKKYRILAILALISFFIIFYLGANHFSVFPVHTPPLYDWEKSIPFLPWTVFFYLLAYIQVIFAIYLVDEQNLKKTLRGILGLIAFHGLFFFFYPTSYPRPPFPADMSPLSNLGYSLIIFLDNPNNCFPSLHVAVSLLSALIIWKKSLMIRITSLIVTILTIVSTLTLKQHFFVDIIGGAITAVIFYLIFIYGPRRKS